MRKSLERWDKALEHNCGLLYHTVTNVALGPPTQPVQLSAISF